MHSDHTTVLHGQRFHYTEWGAPFATPVVLLHGITGHARTWDDEAEALAGAHRVLALDLRGHGDSDPAPDGDYTIAAMAGDVAAFLRALDLDRVSVVGLSMGGRVGIGLAAMYSRHIARLLVVDIGPDIAQAGRMRVGAMMAASPERFESLDCAVAFARAGNPRYAEHLLRRRIAHGLRPLADGGFAWKYDRALREAIRSGQWRDTIDLWPLWQSLTCPTLLVRGAESDVLSADTARQMIETLPHARLVEVSGAGHTVPGDQPAVFLEILTSFLSA